MPHATRGVSGDELLQNVGTPPVGRHARPVAFRRALEVVEPIGSSKEAPRNRSEGPRWAGCARDERYAEHVIMKEGMR